MQTSACVIRALHKLQNSDSSYKAHINLLVGHLRNRPLPREATIILVATYILKYHFYASPDIDTDTQTWVRILSDILATVTSRSVALDDIKYQIQQHLETPIELSIDNQGLQVALDLIEDDLILGLFNR